jgi:hypothetical protein
VSSSGGLQRGFRNEHGCEKKSAFSYVIFTTVWRARMTSVGNVSPSFEGHGVKTTESVTYEGMDFCKLTVGLVFQADCLMF